MSKKHKKFHETNSSFQDKNKKNSKKKQKKIKAKLGKDLSEDSTKYTRGSVKGKIYYTLPRPKRGKWIVILKRL